MEFMTAQRVGHHGVYPLLASSSYTITHYRLGINTDSIIYLNLFPRGLSPTAFGKHDGAILQLDGSWRNAN